jgi:RecA-family ATPase
MDARTPEEFLDELRELPVVTAASLAGSSAPPRQWIVPEIIPDRQVTIVSGDGAVGKSTLLLQLAVAVATGREWIGTSPITGPVLFASAEDEFDEQWRRLEAIVNSMAGLLMADLTDLHIIPLAGLDAIMAAPDKTGILKTTPIWRGLVKRVEEFRPKLVVLDPLADVFGGDEIKRQHARQFVSIGRKLGIDYNLGVLLPAHPSLQGMATGTGSSGSTGWGNSARARLYFETIKGDGDRELDPNLRVLRMKKSNYGPPNLELRVRWHKGCYVLNGASGGFDKLAADAKAERVFLDLLALLQARERDVSPKPSPAYAPVVFAKHPKAEGVTKTEFANAMERLLAAGRISVETIGPPSRRYKRLIVSPTI